jgi:hypothetical protein
MLKPGSLKRLQPLRLAKGSDGGNKGDPAQVTGFVVPCNVGKRLQEHKTIKTKLKLHSRCDSQAVFQRTVGFSAGPEADPVA